MKYFYATTFGVLALGGALLIADSEKPVFGVKEERQHAEKLIRELGAEAAYETFKQTNKQRSVTDQHTAGHVFGDALYESIGVAGLGICDSEAGFACFHGVIGHAIAEHGHAAVGVLEKKCLERFGEGGLGCFHGIGHGVLTEVGYARESLDEALSTCETLSTQRAIQSCVDGVFMEYNFRSMDTVRARPLSTGGEHEPCADIEDQFKARCYFALPAWWLTTQSADASALCAEAPALQHASCYRGIGYAIAPPDFDGTRAGRACDAFLADGRLWCREGVALALFVDPMFRPQAEAVCRTSLTPEESIRCLKEYAESVL